MLIMLPNVNNRLFPQDLLCNHICVSAPSIVVAIRCLDHVRDLTINMLPNNGGGRVGDRFVRDRYSIILYVHDNEMANEERMVDDSMQIV